MDLGAGGNDLEVDITDCTCMWSIKLRPTRRRGGCTSLAMGQIVAVMKPHLDSPSRFGGRRAPRQLRCRAGHVGERL